jgi:LysM repeat protein
MSTMVLPAVTATAASRPSHPAQRRGAPAAQGALRLTRRGRLVVFLAGLLVAVAVAVAFAGGSVATAEKGQPVPTDVIVVGTGVTLWDIASARAEGGDVREVMSTIQRLNHLEGGLLVAGQQLRVPAAD